ncbi:hypothetical protein [Bowmanella denitrificans]|uniref:hypothetical protein n=1 Tax=Bowmanella denitrificans TaxID=366582 RepID=UPI000C998A55|nr:hypothetical protein [Bowmanella denitrificans]
MSRIQTLLSRVLLVPVFIFVSVLIHEYGHVLAVKCIPQVDVQAFIWPGIELYPKPGQIHLPWSSDGLGYMRYIQNESAFKQQDYAFNLMQDWQGLAIWNPRIMQEPLSQAQHGWVMFCGSAANLLIATICLLVLCLFKPHRVVRKLSILGAMLAYDMLLYSLLPLLGLRHLVFWGGYTAEPVQGLILLGVPEQIASLSLIGLPIIMLTALLPIARRASRYP